jgi:hypothetical protein
MDEPAQRHARYLISKYGSAKAREIVREKIDDAPFLTNGDRAFWVAVLECLR